VSLGLVIDQLHQPPPMRCQGAGEGGDRREQALLQPHEGQLGEGGLARR
jgi:hypothetical protein